MIAKNERLIYIAFVALVTLGNLCYRLVQQYLNYKTRSDFDWMFISGLIAFYAIANLSMWTETWYELCVRRILGSGIIMDKNIGLEQMVRAAKFYVGKNWLYPGAVVFVVEGALFLFFFPAAVRTGNLMRLPFSNTLNTVLSAAVWLPMGLLVAYRIGVISCLGHLNKILAIGDIDWEPLVFHPDKRCGTAYVGYFLSFPSLLIFLPLVWTIFWFLALPNWKSVYGTDYSAWKLPLELTVVMCISTFILCVILPLFSFHNTMKLKLGSLNPHIDSLFQEVTDFRANLHRSAKFGSAFIRGEQRAGRLAQTIDALRAAPSWPINAITALLWIAPHAINLALATLFVKNAEGWLKNVLGWG
jgi:hypothetical protein